ncbi:hypothetical protein F5146DRAFT_1129479 [Armillaria mellea]|nr:hypothetical protein F5146DRAFT_1129479 [Armillaria mellea]
MHFYMVLMAEVFYILRSYATFWKVSATEEEPDFFTVSPIVQDDKFLSFADYNGYPTDVVVTPGDPYFPGLQWRISSRDEGLRTAFLDILVAHIGQDRSSGRIVGQAADRESPNQLWSFILINWAAAEHQDNVVQVPTSLEPGCYRIRPLIRDALALVAGTDRKDNIRGADVIIRPNDPHNPQVQWLLQSSEDNDRTFSIVNSRFYDMSLGFDPYTRRVEAAKAKHGNSTQLWIFECLNNLVEEETSQEDTLAVESKAQFFDLFSELAAFITARI